MEFLYYEEEDVSTYDSDDDELCGLISDADKKKLKEWCADVNNWKRMSRIQGRGFEGGARFVPCKPDGNCMFNGISVIKTASKELPSGTDKHHDEIRQKACDWIVKERHGKCKELLQRRGIVTDEKFNLYVAKKRSTTGQVYTWSDNITANAVAASQGRGPIMQVTYPVYKRGKACPELGP